MASTDLYIPIYRLDYISLTADRAVISSAMQASEHEARIYTVVGALTMARSSRAIRCSVRSFRDRLLAC